MDRPKPFNGLDIKLEATEMHDQLPYPELGILLFILLMFLFIYSKPDFLLFSRHSERNVRPERTLPDGRR